MADRFDDSALPETAGACGATPGMPRWVKVLGGIALLVVVLVGIFLLTGGNHGPGRHTGSGGSPPAEVQEAGGHQPPAGGHAP